MSAHAKPVAAYIQVFIMLFSLSLAASAQVVTFSTYFGGSGPERANAVAVDADGNIIVAGATFSGNLAGTSHSVQPSIAGDADAFVAKFSPDGHLIFSTYLGGSTTDVANAVAVDAAGFIYVAGETQSGDFPIHNAHQVHNGGDPLNDNSDFFVAKLSPCGTQLVFSTYFGGVNPEWANAIAVNAASNVYVAGVSLGGPSPVSNGFQMVYGGGFSDGLLAEFDASGSLVYATYLGGGDEDEIHRIAPATDGSVWLLGETVSSDFPTVNAWQNQLTDGTNQWGSPSRDLFLTQIGADGAALVTSTYFGGVDDDWARSLALDSQGRIHMAGATASDDLPMRFAHTATRPGTEAGFYGRFNADGTQLEYATYLGGSGQDGVTGLAISESNNVYLGGWTYSTDFPSARAVQPDPGGELDAWLMRWGADGHRTSSCFGGGNDDLFSCVAVDRDGSAIFAGYTVSADFPVRNAAQTVYGGNADADPWHGGDAVLVKLGGPTITNLAVEGDRIDVGWAPVDQQRFVIQHGASLTAPDWRDVTADIDAVNHVNTPLTAGGTGYLRVAVRGAATLTVTSPTITGGDPIPPQHARLDGNVSPALLWTNVPVETQSFAILCDDPDAPGGTWSHWVLFDLPGETRNIAATQPKDATLANGARQGLNSWNLVGYDGPQPPVGETHRYVFRVYALDTVLGLDPAATRRDDLLNAMNGRVLGYGTLTGPYSR